MASRSKKTEDALSVVVVDHDSELIVCAFRGL
jgi:hypothetical protein